jgi:methionyl-tRNA formyltransferase
MNVLYYTNPDVDDVDVITSILKEYGDNVFTHTKRVTPTIIEEHKIDWIVSDRPRFLIRSEVLSLLPRRIVNLHPSFLPWNRGYHPNFWSIVEGTPSGVTLHYIDEDIDSGNVISQTRIYYTEEDTLRTTYKRLRRHMVNLFATCWLDIRAEKTGSIVQDITGGTLHYRRDFDGQFEKLYNGWDTTVKEIQSIFSPQ